MWSLSTVCGISRRENVLQSVAQRTEYSSGWWFFSDYRICLFICTYCFVELLNLCLWTSVPRTFPPPSPHPIVLHLCASKSWAFPWCAALVVVVYIHSFIHLLKWKIIIKTLYFTWYNFSFCCTIRKILFGIVMICDDGSGAPGAKDFSFLQRTKIYEWSFALGAWYVGWPIRCGSLKRMSIKWDKANQSELPFVWHLRREAKTERSQVDQSWSIEICWKWKQPLVLLFYYLWKIIYFKGVPS